MFDEQWDPDTEMYRVRLRFLPECSSFKQFGKDETLKLHCWFYIEICVLHLHPLLQRLNKIHQSVSTELILSYDRCFRS